MNRLAQAHESLKIRGYSVKRGAANTAEFVFEQKGRFELSDATAAAFAEATKKAKDSQTIVRALDREASQARKRHARSWICALQAHFAQCTAALSGVKPGCTVAGG